MSASQYAQSSAGPFAISIARSFPGNLHEDYPKLVFGRDDSVSITTGRENRQCLDWSRHQTGKEKLQEPEIVCNKPYIRFETNCCLDKNDNKICDGDETPEVVKSPLYDDFLRTEARKISCGQPRSEARELLYPLKYTVKGEHGHADYYVHEENTMAVSYSMDKGQVLQIQIDYGDGSEKPTYRKECS